MPPINPPSPHKPGASGSARPVVHRRATPPPPVVAYEDVVAACGHPEKFGLFEDRKDKFRNDRRKKVTDRPCRACREKKRLEEEAAAAARKAERAQRAAANSRPAKRPGPKLERLPDGSKFDVRYDATRELWSGTLVIQGQTFTDSASGVFNLLTKLDRQYRKATAPASPPPSE